ncbi:MAG TPA: hypothetical protein PK942_14170, partial [Verrucomicrobiota bacterium]|nr:hypothetical protein [Verrucomicrobiota bacterium]
TARGRRRGAAAKMPVEFGARGGYLLGMRRAWIWFWLVGWLVAAGGAPAATGRVIKVLPQFLDLKGRNSLSPSLYERDIYQARLRDHTNECSGMRFNVQWKTRGQPAAPLKLRAELRGVAHGDFPRQITLETPVQRRGWFSQWTWVALVGREYADFGRVTAWRVTLWEGDRLLGEQRSYLW